MSVLRSVHEIMFLMIILAVVTIFIMIMWKTAPQECYTEINGTYSRVITNVQKCADLCWRKHNHGNDLDNDDCFVVNVYSENGNVTNVDLENEYIKCYFNVIEQGKSYRLKIRYDASASGIGISII